MKKLKKVVTLVLMFSFIGLNSSALIPVLATKTAEATELNQVPADGVVHVFKFLDGVQATPQTANNASFPMYTDFYSSGYTLSSTGLGQDDIPYEGSTGTITGGQSYSTYEVLGTNVGETCEAGKPFELAGYSTGGTLQEAIANQQSTNTPEVVVNGDKYIIVWNNTCQNNPAPQNGKVHIFKFIDGVQATAQNADSATFPMFTATYNAPYPIGPTGYSDGDIPYEASTNEIVGGNTYTTNEDTTTSLVGTSCSNQNNPTYELAGYTSGSTMQEAINAGPNKTLTPPILTIDGDKYIIVWNHKCTDGGPFRVRAVKFIDGVHATKVTANDTRFPIIIKYNSDEIIGVLIDSGQNNVDVPDQAYEYSSNLLGPNDTYSVIENIGTGTVSDSCTVPNSTPPYLHPYMLEGYSVGDTYQEAEGAPITMNTPVFSNLTHDKVVIIHNIRCQNNPQDGQVHVIKYIDGVPATAENVNSNSFSMHATTTIGEQVIEGEFTLGPDGYYNGIDPVKAPPYQANSWIYTGGTKYSTHENFDSMTGDTCDAGKPYALVGYTTGSSEVEAIANFPNVSKVTPEVTLDWDKYIIVWNKKCALPVQTSTVTMCKVNENQVALPNWTLMLRGDKVEDLNVPTNTSTGIDTSVPLVAGTSYIAKAIGTWLNQGGVNPADTEYSTTDGWVSNIMDGYTGYSSDILELQIDSKFDPNSNWGAYNSLHTYAQSFIPTGTSSNFRIFDGTGTVQNLGWFTDNSGSLAVSIYKGFAGITNEDGCVTFTDVPYGTYNTDEIMKDGWSNVSGLEQVIVDQSTETFTVVNHDDSVPPPTTATISAQKVVCDSEADLPNWGDGSGPNITSTTASDYVANSDGRCHLAEWNFEWAPANVGNDNNNTEVKGAPWTAFTGTAVIPAGSLAWVREQIPAGYVPFNGDTEAPYDNNVSAEFYCHTDVLNYDNYDWIDPVVAGSTYYCVGFNALAQVLGATTLKVHVYKYLSNNDGIHQVADDSTAPSFPMVSTWMTANLNGGVSTSGNYVLGNNHGGTALRYNADTAPMEAPADYTTSEVTDGSVVVPTDSNSCPEGKYKLLGYKSSTVDFAGALSASLATTAPVFTTLGADAYVIVVNEKCPDPVPPNPTGSIEITKYVCPPETTVIRSANGVGGTVPGDCVLQNGKTFGYVHGSQADANGPYPELAGPFIEAGTTAGNGVLTIGNLPATGRYLVVETDGNGGQLLAGDILGLYCQGDGDQTNNNDNQELTFVPDNGVVHCVAYNKAPVVTPPTSSICSDGTDNDSDGLKDEADPGCHPSDHNVNNHASYIPEGDSEVTGALPECSDGLDNDSQEGIDSNDPNCYEGNNPDGVYVPTNLEGGGDAPITKVFTTTSGGSGGHGGGFLNTAPQGQVLGATTTCGIYVDKFLRKGYKNDIDAVKKVQKFLNEYMKAGLPENGIFGPNTEKALKKFQAGHRNKVLDPWGLKVPTGIFYLTTQTEVNNIMCPELNLPIPPLTPMEVNPLAPKKD